MTLEDFTYWGDCIDCGEAMDESEANQCEYCRNWVCDKCIDAHEVDCAKYEEDNDEL